MNNLISHYQYYQLKHTVKATNEKVVNMPKRDGDWWKTIAVWIEFIKDNVDSTEAKFFSNVFVYSSYPPYKII